MTSLRCDLVLGGGGIRGLAHIGALEAFESAGYEIQRAAGASAGAIAGALAVSGVGPDEFAELARDLDFRAFALADLVARLSGARAIGSMVDRFGPDRTDPTDWLTEQLGARGVSTFADLRLAGDDAPVEARWRLVVRCLDVANRRVVRLPWDYPRYGLDPDSQPVARAVRASMSIPFVYDPVRIGEPGHTPGLLVDGGLGSGFPVALLDRRDGHRPRWPTFGVRLLPRPEHGGALPEGNVALVRALVETLLEAGDAMESPDPCDAERTVRIDVSGTRWLDVAGEDEDYDRLVDAGRRAVADFLDGWDEQEHLDRCR